jgi:hypothetical protein
MATWFNTFRCLRPLNAARFPEAIRSVYTMLATNGYRLMPWNDLVALGDQGMVKCDCSKYMRYCWCYHSCSLAKSRGIITHYPPTLDVGKMCTPRRGVWTRTATPGNALVMDMNMQVSSLLTVLIASVNTLVHDALHSCFHCTKDVFVGDSIFRIDDGICYSVTFLTMR